MPLHERFCSSRLLLSDNRKFSSFLLGYQVSDDILWIKSFVNKVYVMFVFNMYVMYKLGFCTSYNYNPIKLTVKM